jgi:DNA-damage-inducible protein D
MPAELTLPPDNLFDALRGADGHWSARDLMPHLGYDRWENFEEAIERARLSARNSKFNEANHFFPTSRRTKGRPAADWKLTRFGAYLVALNGDPRKPETAAAQAYFVVRAREAEVAAAAPPTPAIPKSFSEALRLAADLSEQNEQQKTALALAAPKVALHDLLLDSRNNLSVADAAHALGGMGQNTLFRELRRLRLILDSDRPYQSAVDNGWLTTVAQPYRAGGEEGEDRVRNKVLVTPKGLIYIARRLGLVLDSPAPAPLPLPSVAS